MFVSHGPLDPESDLFMGREAELETMARWLGQVRNVGAVLGARQTGKTSLLLKLGHRLRNKYSFAYVDLEAIHGATVSDCFAFIAEEIAQQVGDSKSFRWPDDSRNFLAFLRDLSQESQKVRIAVMLDEVGALPHETAVRLAHTIRAAFTSRYVRQEYRRFVFILAGANDMLALTTNVSSPLKNVTESVYLNDLTTSEAENLIGQGFDNKPVKLSKPVLDRVFYWTHGHPYLTQMLASKLDSQQASLTVASIDSTVSDLLQTEDRNLPHIFRTLDASSNMLWMVVKSILDEKEVRFNRSNQITAELELVGLVRNEDGRCQIRNRIYEEAIRKHLHEQNLYDGGPTGPQNIHQIIVDYFSLSDLESLCFELSIDFDDIPGQTKTEKVHGLVTYCSNHGLTSDLEHTIRAQRPNLFQSK